MPVRHARASRHGEYAEHTRYAYTRAGVADIAAIDILRGDDMPLLLLITGG